MVKGEPQKAKTLVLPFVPYLRSTVPETTEPKDLIQGHFRKYQLGNAYSRKEQFSFLGVSPISARHQGGRLSRLFGLIKDSLCYRPVFYMSVVEPHEGLVTRPSRQVADGVPVYTSLHRYRCGHASGRMRFKHWSLFAQRLVCRSNTIPQPMGQPLGRQG